MNHSPLITTPLLVFAGMTFLLWCVRRAFPLLGLTDFPQRYGLTRSSLPYPTGSAAVLMFVLVFPFLQPFTTQSAGLLAAILLLAITCFIDDRKQISPFIRLSVQCACAVLIFASGDCTGSRICSITNPLEGLLGGSIIELNGSLPILSFIVTVVWLMLTTNALNWFDGIPGQTSAISAIGFLTIGLLSLSERVDQPDLALIALCLAAVAAASFLFDVQPLTVPGDTGSMFFGLMLGTLTIYGGGKVATAFLVLGVPIVDLLFVTIRRAANGRSPFRGSMRGEHLHHRLLEHGWKRRHIIALTAAIGTIFGVTALFLDTRGKFIAAGILLVLMTTLSLYADRKRTSD